MEFKRITKKCLVIISGLLWFSTDLISGLSTTLFISINVNIKKVKKKFKEIDEENSNNKIKKIR